MVTHREDRRYVLAVNCGSSSLKVTLYAVQADELKSERHYVAALIGQPHAQLQVTDSQHVSISLDQPLGDHSQALRAILYDLSQQIRLVDISQVGYRLVHGGQDFYKPVILQPDIIKRLAAVTPLAPEHMPLALDSVNYLFKALPKASHVACFDTEFFHDLPEAAQSLPLPLQATAHPVRRYGFHGLSYEYLLDQLATKLPQLHDKRLVLAHLGSGASLAAVQDSKPLDTTMGFSPSSGLMMSTRSGDLDPGLVLYLQETQQLSPQELSVLINHHSGLLGVSGTTADMQALLEDTAPRSQLAVEMFCLQVKKAIGAFAALLGGVDGLIFSGGIGYNAAVVRQRTCQGLEGFGLELDESLNNSDQLVISRSASPAMIVRLDTDEQVVIARKTLAATGGPHA